jgi:hypothetical protein
MYVALDKLRNETARLPLSLQPNGCDPFRVRNRLVRWGARGLGDIQMCSRQLANETNETAAEMRVPVSR